MARPSPAASVTSASPLGGIAGLPVQWPKRPCTLTLFASPSLTPTGPKKAGTVRACSPMRTCAISSRLRSAAHYAVEKENERRIEEAGHVFVETLPAPVVRFLCAGEQGSRNGRCHWHLILFSNLDLLTLGEITLRGRKLTDRADIMTVGKRKRRCHWSLWADDKTPLGFVTFQEPDQGGMSYVLSYCLKDQFTVERSRDTMREAKAEDFATGLFRMSKKPAIGEGFFMRKLEALALKGQVLPSLNITIPDFGGFYHPSGTTRKSVLWALTAANNLARWSTGADAPQWSSLLGACADNINDMEILVGQETEELEPGAQAVFNARWRADELRRTREARFNRDWQGVCDPCLEATRGRVQSFRVGDDWRFRTSETHSACLGKASWIEKGGPPALSCSICGKTHDVWAVYRSSGGGSLFGDANAS